MLFLYVQKHILYHMTWYIKAHDSEVFSFWFSQFFLNILLFLQFSSNMKFHGHSCEWPDNIKPTVHIGAR